MASGKKLGIFWGSSAFTIIEAQQDAPIKTFRVPYLSGAPADPTAASMTPQVDDLRLASLLKEALKANKVTATDVYLALPSKDIVIRSFVIPFLKAHEIKGVVEFEIKKYIPFNLKELAYSFHATPLIEDKVKRMRVHFVAIRREILEHYSSVLKHAGLNVVFSEPAPMCLTRALIAKKFIKPDHKVAIVQTDFTDSRIVVFDTGVVQFVRDFQLHNPALNAPTPEPELLKKKLFNEIKISLDFYMRQFKSEKIAEIATISFDPSQDIVEQLQKELETPVKPVDPHAVVNFPDISDIGVINAFGAILNPIAKTALFNLSGTVTVSKTNSLPALLHVPEEYFPAFKVGVIGAALVFGIFILTKFTVAQTKKKYDVLVEQIGPFLDMSLASIQQKVVDNTTRLETNRNIFRKTEMAAFLVHLPKLLPEGVWLIDLNIQYNPIVEVAPKPIDMKNAGKTPVRAAPPPPSNVPQVGLIVLEMGGYAYMKDSNQQFRVVYGVVDALKTDELFKKYIKSVNLVSIQSEQKDGVSVTSFKINGK
jgi:hypothetical protein